IKKLNFRLPENKNKYAWATSCPPYGVRNDDLGFRLPEIVLSVTVGRRPTLRSRNAVANTVCNQSYGMHIHSAVIILPNHHKVV
ncbi:MAG: hypothetical protein IKZ88_07750, partial [Neisseriaceae bacterium]|nr:hypothetical protein [Neisseriaceae bacterium]